MIRLTALLILVAPALVAQPQDRTPAQQLAAAEVQLRTAEAASDRVAALTQAYLAYEAGLTAVRAAQREIAQRQQALAETLAGEQDRISRLVTVLTTIARAPAPVRLAHPDGPTATVRAGMLLADMTPALTAEADRMAALVQAGARIEAERAATATALIEGQAGVAAARAALLGAMADGDSLPQRFADDPTQTAVLLAGVETLQGLADGLAATHPDPVERLEPLGNLPLPVAGLILSDDGYGRAGVRIAATPRALVTTPVTATVLFQGPFLDYGRVVILEPAPDVVFVLAGLAEVFASTGQVLPAGTPIGLMPGNLTGNDGILTENSGLVTGSQTQSLYLEVREGQTPVQTDRWFALE